MQARTLKFLAFGLIALSIVLAFVGIRLSKEPQTNAVALAPESRYRVMVTTKDIEPNTVLTAEDVQSIPYPLSTGGTYTKPEEVIGKEVYVRVPMGEVLRTSHFEITSVLAEQVTPGFRAIAVTVDETVGTGGYLLPGDKVDVIFASRGGRSGGNDGFARRILNNVKVLAFGNVIQGTQDDSEAPTGKRSRTAVLEVPESEISKLLLAETSGTIRLAAVGDREVASADLEAEPKKISDFRADMNDLNGKPKKSNQPPPPKVYVYHGDSVETVRTTP